MQSGFSWFKEKPRMVLKKKKKEIAGENFDPTLEGDNF